MLSIELYDSIGFYFSLLKDLERKTFVRLCLPFWKPSGAGLGGELTKKIESVLSDLARSSKLFILTNKDLLKKLPPAFLPVSRVVKDGFFLHSKVILIEDKVSYIGSANLTFDRVESVINHVARIEEIAFYTKLKISFDYFYENSQ